MSAVTGVGRIGRRGQRGACALDVGWDTIVKPTQGSEQLGIRIRIGGMRYVVEVGLRPTEAISFLERLERAIEGIQEFEARTIAEKRARELPGHEWGQTEE